MGVKLIAGWGIVVDVCVATAIADANPIMKLASAIGLGAATGAILAFESIVRK